MFQLDLSKRLEEAGVKSVVILTRTNYNLFSQFLQVSNLSRTYIYNGHGKKFFWKALIIVCGCAFSSVSVINAFDVKSYSLYTRLFYLSLTLLGGEVFLYGYDKRLEKKRVYFLKRDEKEMIWRRNIRIVKALQPSYESSAFPAVRLTGESIIAQKNYIHIHVVASALVKSFPPQRTIELVRKLSQENDVIISMTPKEELWYFNQAQIEDIRMLKRVTILSKQFTASQITGLIQGSKLFCTVNTGLLWLSRLLDKKTVVFDSATDYEWNPEPYHNVTRVCHDYDENGKPLLSVKASYPDGVFFTSMYLITLEEALEAVLKGLKD